MVLSKQPLRTLHLFAGGGGGILADILLGHTPVCAVELNAYCRNEMLARQRDGVLPRFPIWDDVRTFNGQPWQGRVDVVCGGFPCQDISSAGKRAGIDGERSGLWSEFARVIGEIQPPFVFVENSPHLRTRGLVRVLKNLAGMGYNATWGVLGADAVRAPHKRKRMWIVAHTNNPRERVQQKHAEVGRAQATQGVFDNNVYAALVGGADWWPVDLISGVDDGMAHRMDRVRATGNGQVPRVAALAWRLLTARLQEQTE